MLWYFTYSTFDTTQYSMFLSEGGEISCTPFGWGGKRIEAHIISVAESALESNQNGVLTV
jgi:hypothetical protein